MLTGGRLGGQRSRGSVVLAAVLWLIVPASAAPAAPPPPPPPAPPAPPGVTETITVTATRTERRLGDTAASVVVLDQRAIAASASPAIDDILRQVPGFSLFRRTSSPYANPTTQGVSLRGLASSGASRSVVIEDGVRLNDPFGSWVYWGRVPLAAVERLEVLRGAASDLYGSGAMSGVIQVVTRGAAASQVLADASYGSERTGDASAFAAERHGDWRATAAAESFGTGGYVAIAPDLRGPIDTPVTSTYESAQGTVERVAEDAGRLFVRGGYYGESRDNGTPQQRNDTEIRQWAAGGDWQPWDGSLAARLDGASQGFFQTFTAVAPDRESETLTRAEAVPSRSLGFSAQGTGALTQSQGLVAGADLSQVTATTDETAFLAAGGTSQSAVAARQRTGGLFLEDLVNVSSRLEVNAGVRGDLWRNSAEPSGAAAPAAGLPSREQTAWSPRLGAVVRATDGLRLTVSAYRAFRAPTLNELYRSFRVGNVVTEANPDLNSEHLSGVESGALWSGLAGRVTARAVLFWMEIDRPVANVTVAQTPTLITRERENLGRTRSRGVEAEVTARLAPGLTLAAGGALDDATVVSFAAEPALVGNRVPEVPRESLSLGLTYEREQVASFSLQARYVGQQFDDDLNQLPLRSWTGLDATATRPLPRGLAVFVAGENLFGNRAEVARTPLLTLGAPRLLRVGVRWAPSTL
jgi:outer membrane receptor protein involved in Fe transport